MAEILSRLNAPQSPLWSSKCDVWEVKSLADVGFDHFDLEAGASETHTVIASYIDLLPQREQPWKGPSHAEHIAKSLCAQLTAAQQKCCRIDLIIRRAIFAHDVSNFGITAYCTACGIDQFSAQTAHVRALNAFTDAALFQGGHMKAKSR
ncbi:MAG: hypothetical protein KGN79_12425 [Acidobacteriota bacterium]|nr:hypothetical protein [Acidobacteriota bacterium]